VSFLKEYEAVAKFLWRRYTIHWYSYSYWDAHILRKVENQ